MTRRVLVPGLLAAGALLACTDSPARPTIDQPVASLTAVPGPGEAIPTGERIVGQTGIEAVYDAEHEGAIGFVSTPLHAQMHANPTAWSPIYVVVYPTTATSVGTLLCEDVPSENCPDHGPELAGLAQQVAPDVYGDGVLGHDHIMDYPGGDEFDVAWEPIAVVFTNSEAANSEHLVTDAQIEEAVNNGDAVEIDLPSATFHCAAVSRALWEQGTPVAP